jgi:hypothetical protein
MHWVQYAQFTKTNSRLHLHLLLLPSLSVVRVGVYTDGDAGI